MSTQNCIIYVMINWLSSLLLHGIKYPKAIILILALSSCKNLFFSIEMLMNQQPSQESIKRQKSLFNIIVKCKHLDCNIVMMLLCQRQDETFPQKLLKLHCQFCSMMLYFGKKMFVFAKQSFTFSNHFINIFDDVTKQLILENYFKCVNKNNLMSGEKQFFTQARKFAYVYGHSQHIKLLCLD